MISRRILTFAGMFAAALVASSTVSAENYRFMTGPQGGSWIPLGGAMKDAWERALPGVTVQAIPGAGIANVRAIEEGKAEIGFGNSITTVDAITGAEPFKTPHKNVCNLATLYPQYFQVVVPADSGIKSIKELKGKSITTQPRGNTAELITQQLLKVNGITYNDVKVSFLSYTDGVAQIKDGHAVAIFMGTTIPAGAVMDIAASRNIALIDLGDQIGAMKKLNPGYTLNTIKGGTYPKVDKETKVIGYATHIVASCKLPEDKVYGMVKTMATNIKGMAAVVRDIEPLTVKDMADDIGVPLHPGAQKYYKEAGLKM